MSELLAASYAWLKAGHIIAVIAWMAGLLYLPRLYVYHAAAPIGSDRAATFQVMERRLLRGIMLPALIGTYLFGLLLIASGVVNGSERWLQIKLALVLLLTIFHMLLARWRRDFAADRYPHTPRFFRVVNEVPTLAMIGIVLLVVVKPF